MCLTIHRYRMLSISVVALAAVARVPRPRTVYDYVTMCMSTEKRLCHCYYML